MESSKYKLALIFVLLTGFCFASMGQNEPRGRGYGEINSRDAQRINQTVALYFKNLTNLTVTESHAIQRNLHTFSVGQALGQRLDRYERPDNFEQWTPVQQGIYDVLFHSEITVRDWTAGSRKMNTYQLPDYLLPDPISLDPWRKINGKIVYVPSPDSGFQHCYGIVSQTIEDGVLVRPIFSGGTEYFIKHFPFKVPDEYQLEGSKFMAINDGVKTFTTVLGARRSLTALDYGEPCKMPQGGEKIEQEVLAERNKRLAIQVKAYSDNIIEQQAAALASKQRLADFIQQLEDAKNDEKLKNEVKKQSIKQAGNARALIANQDAADKGDAYGLLRMGERYRDGDGVEKDLAKAREYFTKAATAGSSTAAAALEKMPGSAP